MVEVPEGRHQFSRTVCWPSGNLEPPRQQRRFPPGISEYFCYQFPTDRWRQVRKKFSLGFHRSIVSTWNCTGQQSLILEINVHRQVGSIRVSASVVGSYCQQVIFWGCQYTLTMLEFLPQGEE